MDASPPQPNQLLTFFRKGHKRVYKRGEIILHAGDEPPGVYLIEQGFVKIYALSREGNEHIHLFYGDSDIFPLMWIYGGIVRNAFYEALTETTVWLMPRDDFRDFVAKDPGVADRLLDRSVGLFRLYASRIDNLLYSNSFERTAYTILALAYRFGKKTADGYVIDEPLTHQHIASSINLSRETTSRAMERLQNRGIIGYDSRHHILIKNPSKLIAIIGEDEINAMWPDLIARMM